MKRLTAVGLMLACFAAPYGVYAWQQRERVIYERPSAVNGRVIVTEDGKGVRRMRFEGERSTQTAMDPRRPEDLKSPYFKVMRDALIFARETPRTVAIVGMGGGALPRWFRVTLPGVIVDAIEYDREVIAAARSVFGVLEDKRLRIHEGDGRQLLRELPGPFDVVILDAFGAEDYPQHLVTADFFAEVRGKLTPGGMVLANLLGRSHNPRYADMLGTFVAVFPSVAVWPVPGRDQVVVIARKDREAQWSAVPDVRPITAFGLGSVTVLRDEP